MSVYKADVVICPFSKFDGGYILESEYCTVAFGTDDHILVVCHILIASAVFEHISECVLGFCSQSSGRCFEVLLGEYVGDVGRHESVFRHLSRIKPYAERVVSTSDFDFSDSCDTGESWFDVDLQVVDDELPVEGIVRTIYGECFDTAGLTLAHCDAASCHLGRKKALGGGYSVLYIDHRHVSVSALAEVDLDCSVTCVCCSRDHVHHVLDAVDGLLERHKHTLLHCLGVRSCVGCRYAYRRRRDFRELLDRKL